MEKRFQIFVSSTFADLQAERSSVIQALMEMDCIPAGMELFPAADEEQWAFIRRVIEDCDYYVLIIGGRYGSVTSDGIRYTEKEFDYAVERGIKVIALIHNKPEVIVAGKTEIDAGLREKLEAFRKRVSTDRLVKHWSVASELPGLVALSLQKTIKMYPAVGWVRANTVANHELLAELNELRKHNEVLTQKLAELSAQFPRDEIEGLAGLEESFTVHMTSSLVSRYTGRSEDHWSIKMKWSEIFADIAPDLRASPADATVKGHLVTALVARRDHPGHRHSIDDRDFQTVGLQLKALGLVRIQLLQATNGKMVLFWSLTARGDQLMMKMRTIPTSG